METEAMIPVTHFRSALSAVLALVLLTMAACSDDEPADVAAVGFLVPTGGATIGGDLDSDPDTPGIQMNVQVAVSGFDGNTGTLIVTQRNSEDDTTELGRTEVSGNTTAVVEDVSLEEGTYELVATLETDAGLVAAAAIRVTTSADCGAPTLVFVSPTDGQAVTADDNPDAFDVAVRSTCIGVGETVTCSVAGSEVGNATVAEINELLTFDGVFLPSTSGGETLSLSCSWSEVTSTVAITVSRDLDCMVSLTPPVEPDSCEFDADSDDASDDDAFQADFTVSVGNTDCSDVTLTVGSDEYTATAQDGSASFVVDLTQGRNTIVAEASGPDGLTGTTGERTYFVDTEAPAVGDIENPEADLIGELDDKDDDIENGIQIDVTGVVTNAAGGVAEVVAGGTVIGSADIGGDDAYTIEATFTANQSDLEVYVRVTDGCDNVGQSNTLTLDIRLESLDVGFVAPANASCLLAADDAIGDNDTYDVELDVAAPALDDNDRVRLECRDDVLSDGTEFSVELAMNEFPYVLEDFEDLDWTCTVDGGGNVAVTNFEVDSELPTAGLTIPAGEYLTREATIDVSGFPADITNSGRIEISVQPSGDTYTISPPAAFTQEVALSPNTRNIITVSAIDTNGCGDGNVETTVITIDHDDVPPSLAITDPASENINLGDDLDYTVVVTSNDELFDDEICLYLRETLVNPCQPAVDGGGGVYTASFPVRFLPGPNALRAEALDLARNLGTAELALEVESTLPRIEITEGRLSDETVVSPLDGASIPEAAVDVYVESQLPPGSALTLTLNGTALDPDPGVVTDSDGNAVFADVALLDEFDGTLTGGFNTILVTDVDGVDSNLARVRSDTTAPTVDINIGADAISLANGFVDDVPGGSFQVAVNVDISGFEAGQDVTLTVNCGGGDAPYSETVANDTDTTILFGGVDVPDTGTCSMMAAGSDAVGNDATEDTESIDVDVDPPGLALVSPTETFLDLSFDTLLGTPEIDINLVVSTTEASGDACLYLDGEPRTLIGECVAVAPTTTFANRQLPDGNITLVVVIQDDFNNETELEIDLQVDSTNIIFEFQNPIFEGACLNLANRNGDGNFEFPIFLSENFAGQSIRLCEDPGGAPGTACETDGSFEVLVEDTMTAGFITLETPLSNGSHTFLAELDAGNPRGWIASDTLTITVDATPPTISSWQLTNDSASETTLPNGDTCDHTGYLNAAEVAGTPEADVTLTFGGLDGDSAIDVFSNNPAPNTLVSSGTTTGNGYTFTSAVLAEGLHSFRAEVSDDCGNPLDGGSPTLSFAVDTEIPNLAWVNPTDRDPLLAADCTDAGANASCVSTLRSVDVGVGAPVIVTTTAGESNLTIDGVGDAIGAVSYPQADEVAVAAFTADVACNVATQDITLDCVDAVAPTAAITDVPSPLEDTEPATPGFQTTIEVATTDAEVGRTITIMSTASGSAVGTGVVEGDGTTSIDLALPPGIQTLTADTDDACGNSVTSAGEGIEVAITLCGLSFLSPVGDFLVNVDNPPPTAAEVIVDNLNCFGQTARIRINCATNVADDAACESAGGRVVTQVINGSGSATFSLVFEDGDTTAHAVVLDPDAGTDDVTVPNKTVVFDQTPPSLTITGPTDGMELDIQLTIDQPATWRRNVNMMDLEGPIDLNVSGAIGGSWSATLDGSALNFAAGGTTTDVDISADGALTSSDVIWPTQAGSAAVTFEVTVVDSAGNDTTDSVDVIVDGDPPSAPSVLTELHATSARSGRHDITVTTEGTDDESGGSNVTSYQLLDAEGPTPSWTTEWTSRSGEVVSVDAADITSGYTWERLGLNGDWRVAIRAVDDVGNLSIIVPDNQDWPVDTQLSASLILNDADDLGDPDDNSYNTASANWMVNLGDVSGDDRDDLLVGGAGGAEGYAALVLGQSAPTATILIPTDPADGATLVWGTDGGAAGDVDNDGLNDFFIVDASGDLYLYFGATTSGELTSPDVAINFSFGFTRYGGFGESSHQGWGDFIDLGAEDCDRSGVDTDIPCYDDLVFFSWDFGTRSDIFIVAGRARGDWPATITLAAGDTCADDVMQIAGTGMSPRDGHEISYDLPGVGMGVTSLNADQYADIILSQDGATQLGGVSNLPVWGFYGGRMACASLDLDDSDLFDVVADDAPQNTSSALQFGLPVAPRFGTYDSDNALIDAGGEFIHGHYWRDTATVYVVDGGGFSEAGTFVLPAAPPDGDGPSTDERGLRHLGRSLSYIGNFDQYPLASGTPVPNDDAAFGFSFDGGGGAAEEYDRFYVWLGLTDVVEIVYEPSTQWFGWDVVSLDYTGDGAPDIAVSDPGSNRIVLFY